MNTDISSSETKMIEEKVKTIHLRNAVYTFVIFSVCILFWFREKMNFLHILVFLIVGIFFVFIFSALSYGIKSEILEHLSVEKVVKIKKLFWLADLIYNLVITYVFFVIYRIVI